MVELSVEDWEGEIVHIMYKYCQARNPENEWSENHIIVLKIF